VCGRFLCRHMVLSSVSLESIYQNDVKRSVKGTPLAVP
jgi:hypothetical protein